MYSKIHIEAMKNMDDDNGLLKVFSNKIFLVCLAVAGILAIGFYKKTEKQVRENSGAAVAYKVRNEKSRS